MGKGDFAQQLFNDIKDEVLYDSDVVALESLLFIMLEYDVNMSFENWQYLILKYDIKNLMMNIDFKPIINNYPIKLWEKVGLKQFFKYMQTIPNNKAKLIYDTIFNIYNSNCFIYHYLEPLIKENNIKEEKKMIHDILRKSDDFSTIIFDKTELLRRIILLHLEQKKVAVDLLEELINYIDNKKDRAILNTLIIDYLVI